MRPAILIAALALVATRPAISQDAVSHELRFPELKQQYISIRSTFPVSGESVDLHMAAWTPGSYLIREFASDVERPTFRDGHGQDLDAEKIDKDTWSVALRGDTTLVAEYRVHAGHELSVNTSWASPEFVLVNGTSVFLYSEASRRLSQRVTVVAPESLPDLHCALPREEGVLVARDFDELVDSPIVLADATAYPFEQDGIRYRLVNIGQDAMWDGPRAAQDVQAIVGATNRFWRSLPFEQPYWFFNFLVDNGGGLEHDHGTVIMGHRWQMRKREDYIKWLSLVAHEYFHAWNVRRMRPEGLSHYDYQHEQYSRSLWLVEGLTAYYDNLLLSRAQLVTPEEYLKRLALDLHALEMTPGRKAVSIREASHDAWIRQYRTDANSINQTVSYYVKGAVLALVLDSKLRRDSDNRMNLDTIMRAMWQDHRSQAYPEQAFERAVGDLAGMETRNWLRRLLDGRDELDVDRALDWYGLLLNRHPANNAARASGEPLVAGLGINWDTSQAGLVVANVIEGMSASQAGVLPGDELLAVSGQRITKDRLDDMMGRLQPGMEVSLLLSRRNKIMTIPVSVEEARPLTYELMIDPDFGNRELRRLEDWLGQQLTLNR